MIVVDTMQRKTRLLDSTIRSKICGSSKRNLDKRGRCKFGQLFIPHVTLGVNFIWQPSLGKMVAMILQRGSEVIIGCRTEGNLLDLVTLGSPDVLPIPHGNGVSDDKGNVHHGILDTDALVRSTSEDEVVSGIRVSRAVRI